MEHLAPTPVTIRYLYGNAVGCAFPGCEEPLFRHVQGAKRRVLNTRVAHIHARSPGGPRWDDQMSADDNRDQANLLVLCLLHAAAIDDEPEAFPPDVLRRWKSDAERDDGGELLSDREVAELSDGLQQTVTLNAETIVLGGTHGGGGGAIGAGAFGGRGGDVALFPELRAPEPRVPRASRLVGRVLYLGVDEPDGGSSAVIAEDKVLAAAGGGGGRRVGSGSRSVSERLRVSTLMAARNVEYRDGSIAVLGGGITDVRVPALPPEQLLQVALVVEADGVPAGEYSIHLGLESPTGSRACSITMAFAVQEVGEVVRLLAHQPLQCVLNEPGSYRLVASSDLAELTSLPLGVEIAANASEA